MSSCNSYHPTLTDAEAREHLGSILHDLERLRSRARIVVESIQRDDAAIDRFCDLKEPWSTTQTLHDIAASLLDSTDADGLTYPAQRLRERLDGCNNESLAQVFLEDIERDRKMKARSAALEARLEPQILPELAAYLEACSDMEHDEFLVRNRAMARTAIEAYQAKVLPLPESMGGSLRAIAGV